MRFQKKFISLAILAASVFIFSSCGSVMKKDETNKLKNVAIVSVFGGEEVYADNTGNSLVTMITELSQKDKLMMLPITNYASKRIFEEKRKMFPFPIASQSAVQAEPAIRKLTVPDVSLNCLANGYPLSSMSAKEKDEAVKFLTLAKKYDGAMTVGVICSLKEGGVNIMGFSAGKVKATVYLSVLLYNEDGDVILKKNISGESKNSITKIMGWYKVSEVDKIGKEAADDAIQQFIEWIKKA